MFQRVRAPVTTNAATATSARIQHLEFVVNHEERAHNITLTTSRDLLKNARERCADDDLFAAQTIIFLAEAAIQREIRTAQINRLIEDAHVHVAQMRSTIPDEGDDACPVCFETINFGKLWFWRCYQCEKCLCLACQTTIVSLGNGMKCPMCRSDSFEIESIIVQALFVDMRRFLADLSTKRQSPRALFLGKSLLCIATENCRRQETGLIGFLVEHFAADPLQGGFGRNGLGLLIGAVADGAISREEGERLTTLMLWRNNNE